MSDLKVELDAVRDQGAAVCTHAEALSEDLNVLAGRSVLMTSQWSGAAQEAYLQAYSTWDAQIRELVARLDAAGEVASRCAELYRRTDEQVGSLWGV